MAQVEAFCRGLFLVAFEWLVEFGGVGWTVGFLAENGLAVITWLSKCI